MATALENLSRLSLVVRADGFGLYHAANQAVLEAFETGLLTCASLGVVTPWIAEAAALARAHPEWEIGLELILTCPAAGCRWGPVAGAGTVSSLVETTGTFAPSLPAAARTNEIEGELNAQVERARAWGITPAYLVCEEAAQPAVDPIFRRLGADLGIPACASVPGLQPLPLPAPPRDPLPQVIADVLSVLAAGTYLWLTRPAHDAPETWGVWGEDEAASARGEEALALCSPELRLFLDRRGVERLGLRQYLGRISKP